MHCKDTCLHTFIRKSLFSYWSFYIINWYKALKSRQCSFKEESLWKHFSARLVFCWSDLYIQNIYDLDSSVLLICMALVRRVVPLPSWIVLCTNDFIYNLQTLNLPRKTAVKVRLSGNKHMHTLTCKHCLDKACDFFQFCWAVARETPLPFELRSQNGGAVFWEFKRCFSGKNNKASHQNWGRE